MSLADQIQRESLENRPPALLNLAQLEVQAERSVTYWTARLEEAQAEFDKAQAILDRLRGQETRSRAGTQYKVKEDVLDRVLRALANGSPRKPTGIAGDAGISVSHANGALRELARRGLTRRERHHHGYRHQITDAGMERLTNPDRDQ